MDESRTTVLVVDRDEADRRVFADDFGDPDFAFEFADDAESAMARIVSGDVGVLVIDLSDPNLAGRGLLDRVRADVPILAREVFGKTLP